MILDIVINVYNKEKNIVNIYNKIEEELKNIKHRYIFVDDASTDKTLDTLKTLQKKNESIIKIISLSKKQGKDISIYTGLYHTTHELVCIYDLDLQANVSYITKMYNYLLDNLNYDMVCMQSSYKENSFIKNVELKFINKMYNLNIDNNKTYYRIMRRNVVNSIIEQTKNYPFNLYSLDILGFNTNYFKFDNSNIDNNDLCKYICYSNKPFNLLKITNLFLLCILVLLMILDVTNVIKISSGFLLFIIIFFNIINVGLLDLTIKYFNKEKTYFSIKEKIGFEDKIL